MDKITEKVFPSVPNLQLNKEVNTLNYLFSVLLLAFAFYGIWSFIIKLRDSLAAKIEQMREEKYGKKIDVEVNEEGDFE